MRLIVLLVGCVRFNLLTWKEAQATWELLGIHVELILIFRADVEWYYFLTLNA